MLRFLTTCRARGLLVVAALCVGPSTTRADAFGGFAADGARYLVGADRVCELTAAGAAPRCARQPADAIARLGLDKGTLERGKTARIRATTSGSRIRLASDAGATLLEWDAGSAVAAVGAIYRARDDKRVAVEYTVRRGGRTVDEVVAMALPGAVVEARPAAATPAAAPTVAAEPALGVEQRAARDAAIKLADRHLGKRRWAKAEASARAAIAIDPTTPRAVYVQAAALARLGRAPEAIARLTELARSGRAGVPELLVDARQAAAFDAVRVDAGFRRAVGLEPDPARAPSAYERILGAGGTWEQPSTPCKVPEVGLALDRKARRFALTIRQRCQGDDDATKLAGRFDVVEPGELVLIFPNADAADEKLTCRLARCGDGLDEDCLECALEDLTFTLRVVRR